MALQWFRMYSEARTDKKLETLTDPQHRVWFNLLCYAAEQEARGTLPADDLELLAIEVARGDLILLQDTLQALAKLRIVAEDEDGLEFMNFARRQYDKPSDMPDSTRERKRRSRSVHALSRDVTPCHAYTIPEQSIHRTDPPYSPPPGEDGLVLALDVPTAVSGHEVATAVSGHPGTPKRRRQRAVASADYSPEFERFWTAFPRSEKKRQAYQCWCRLLADGVNAEELILAAEHYAAQRRLDGKESMHPSTFLSWEYRNFEEWIHWEVRDGGATGAVSAGGHGRFARPTGALGAVDARSVYVGDRILTEEDARRRMAERAAARGERGGAAAGGHGG